MRIAIIGSRSYPDLPKVIRYINQLPKGTVIISGGAIGVDRTAAFAARSRGFEVIEYFPNYSLWGTTATHVRNEQIVDDSDEVTAFWDGNSPGTKSVIRYCEHIQKTHRIYL